MTPFAKIVRVALAIGGIVDLGVAILALFFQPLLGPLLDVPTKDPALTTIAGGEFLIVALIYGLLLRDLDRFKPFLWLVFLDQLFAAVLVIYTIAIGEVAGTWKTIGPIPLNVLLAAIFAIAARAKPLQRDL
jgi:hypothetical protein